MKEKSAFFFRCGWTRFPFLRDEINFQDDEFAIAICSFVPKRDGG